MTDTIKLSNVRPPNDGLQQLQRKLDQLERPRGQHYARNLAFTSLFILLICGLLVVSQQKPLLDLQETALHRIHQPDFQPSLSVENGTTLLVAETQNTRIYLVSAQ